MKRLLHSLFITPLRWAIEEVWTKLIAIGLLAGAIGIGAASGGRWWVALILGVALLVGFVLVSIFIGNLSDSARTAEREAEPEGDQHQDRAA